MVEPVSTDQPPEQPAQADGGGAQAIHGPSPSTPPGPGGEEASGAGRPHEAADEDLRLEVRQLRRAMETRSPIDKAMGVLMAAYGLSEDESWKVLVTVSQRTNTKLYAVAEEIVASTQTHDVDARLRQTIAVALKELKAR